MGTLAELFASRQPLAVGWRAPARAVTDRALAIQLMRYRRAVASSYRGLAPAEVEEMLPHGPYLVTPKIDGELWYLMARAGEVLLVTPKGGAIGGIPLLDEAAGLPLAGAAGPEDEPVLIAGELYVAKSGSEGRPRVGDVAKALMSGEPDSLKRVGFMAFDRIGDMSPYDERHAAFSALIEGGKRVKPVPLEKAADRSALLELYDKWCANGAKSEGLVLRDPGGRIYKLKPEFTVDAAIIGYTCRQDEPDQVRSVAMAVMIDDATFMHIANCGNLGSDEDRRQLLKDLAGSEVRADFRIPSSDGSLYKLIEPNFVIEAKASDVQAQDSEGEAIRQKTMVFQGGEWVSRGRLPGASLLHPVWVRHRTDKSVSFEELRAAQIEERTYVEEAGARRAVERKPSQVLRREVYTKTTKGKLAVRKLLVWKTNKDDGSQEYPAYVVHWTDFSPGRKEPLQRTVRPAGSAEKAAALADQLLAENIKKGWQKVEA